AAVAVALTAVAAMLAQIAVAITAMRPIRRALVDGTSVGMIFGRITEQYFGDNREQAGFDRTGESHPYKAPAVGLVYRRSGAMPDGCLP
ncbi:MAG: hypothetical protein ACKO3W_15985, partial [bacterium]